MKNWWNQLRLRDKRFLTIGILFVAAFFIYEIFFAALMNEDTTLSEAISTQQQLLTWMQSADHRIQLLQKLSTHPTTNQNTAALLSLLQKEINNSSFAKNLVNLAQGENNTVDIQLQKVNFDTFITWLTHTTTQHNLTILQMTLTPDGALGIVDCHLLLS